ncbi:MAG: TRAP transporter small permease [Spirochaetes bacterium]|nr:TRAP transporter small permease [Spirochaetota bacterium]
MIIDKIVDIYRMLIRGICKFFEIVAAISLVAMMFIVLYNVVMRYFFANSPGWAEELARQCVVVFSFISIALGVRDKGHLALTVVVDKLLARFSLPIEIMNKFLIMCFGIMMSIYMRPFFILLRYNRLPGSGIPVGYTFIIPTAVGILIALIAAYQIYDHFRYGTDEQQRIRLEQAATAAPAGAKES